MRPGVTAILVAAGLLAATSAIGQALAPTAAIRARQANFREMGTAFKAINDELRKPALGKFVLSSSARQIAGNLRQVGSMFPAGSGREAGLKTAAKPEIWSHQADFARLNAAAIVEADRLVAATRGGDPAAIRAQVKATGGACKGCHDLYRQPD